jgi:hypothetical protein
MEAPIALVTRVAYACVVSGGDVSHRVPLGHLARAGGLRANKFGAQKLKGVTGGRSDLTGLQFKVVNARLAGSGAFIPKV